MTDEAVLPIPNLSLAQHLFTLSTSNVAGARVAALESLLAGIKADKMAPYYRLVTPAAAPLDQALLDGMAKENDKDLEELDQRLAEAEKTEGESEISDALRARANYLTRIGDKERAITAQLLALDKTPGLGSQLDIVLTLVRIGFFFGDHQLITRYLAKAEELVEKGGDWDRRNRLKVYRGLHLTFIRQFRAASDLFVDALSTFTATELVSHEDFISFCLITSAVSLARVDLKKKIIDAPEVTAALPELPVLGDLIHSLYKCRYDKFFVALATLEQTHLLPCRLLAPHARYYVREMRILAYSQLLESYRSLTLDSLSGAFGVSREFMDSELSRYIASSRLHATIDAVNGVVETTRPSVKNEQCEILVRRGDVLLGSVQRLGKVLW